MKNILCLTDSLTDIKNFVKDANVFFFQIVQIDPEEHSFLFFQEIYLKLKAEMDLSKVDLIIAEYVEAIPLVYFMRKDGFYSASFFIPHTNAYPLNILFYFLLVSHYSHPDDLILCGSEQAARGYSQFVNIKALPLCTFGIKNNFQLGDKQSARKKLGLSEDEKILLYNGRFMNDKGLVQLLDAYEGIKKRIDQVSLVLSVNHIDPGYYNHLSPRLRDVILFYRLEHEKMNLLYQSVDLFVSTAVSIFETYGKSPLEAISSGVPAVLPNWDGFPYFINSENGSLANVIYTNEEAPYSFARVDEQDFIDKCCQWLEKDQVSVNHSLPDWAYYDFTMHTLSEMIHFFSKKIYHSDHSSDEIEFSKYPKIIQNICSHYSIFTCEDIEVKAEELGLISRVNPGDLNLLHEFHDQLFKKMDATPDRVFVKMNTHVVHSSAI